MSQCKHEWEDPYGHISACNRCHATGEDLIKEIAELEAELKWLQNQHVRVCSSESKIRGAAQEVVDAKRSHIQFGLCPSRIAHPIDALARALEGDK